MSTSLAVLTDGVKAPVAEDDQKPSWRADLGPVDTYRRYRPGATPSMV
jgi:hypothetical protein